MAAMLKVPLEVQASAVVREIGMRKAVYPGRVTAKKMSQEKADHEVQAMEAVLVTVRDYQAMQPKVLAMHAVVSALSAKLDQTADELTEMLTLAEEHAKHELAQAKQRPDTVLVATADAPQWPFRREPMP